MKDSEILKEVRALLTSGDLAHKDAERALLRKLQLAAVILPPSEFKVRGEQVSRLLTWIVSMLEGHANMKIYLISRGHDLFELAVSQGMTVEEYLLAIEVKWLDWMIFTCQEENN